MIYYNSTNTTAGGMIMVTKKQMEDIRENWQNEELYNAKIINWHYINCFMYIVFSSIPMEKIPYGNSEEEIMRKIQINSDFADLGCLSGKDKPRTIKEIEEAFFEDLKSLGFKYKRVAENYSPVGKETKIAFMIIFSFHAYFFHFLREKEGEWYHKDGWHSMPSKVKKSKYEQMKRKCDLFMYLVIWRED